MDMDKAFVMNIVMPIYKYIDDDLSMVSFTEVDTIASGHR